MNSKKIIQDDILRYRKNKLASTLTLLGLVFTALYFMLLYSVNNSFFYSLTLGFSVIITLVLLLAAFLASESIKNYRKSYCIVLLVLAVLNIIRIFYYPLKGLQADAFKDSVYFWTKMSSGGIFTMLLIYLVASAACYVAAAVVGYLYAIRLEKHEKGVAEGTINIEAALAEEDANAEKAVSTINVSTSEEQKVVAETAAPEESDVKELNTEESKPADKGNDGSSEEVE